MHNLFKFVDAEKNLHFKIFIGMIYMLVFLEVVVQQPLFSSLLLSYIPGGGPGSWLMHFPYVVLHGCFGKF